MFFFQTLYTVKVEVKPEGESKDCRVGSVAVLTLRVQRSPRHRDPTPVLYKTEEKPDQWAITGKSSGEKGCVMYRTNVPVNIILFRYIVLLSVLKKGVKHTIVSIIHL